MNPPKGSRISMKSAMLPASRMGATAATIPQRCPREVEQKSASSTAAEMLTTGILGGRDQRLAPVPAQRQPGKEFAPLLRLGLRLAEAGPEIVHFVLEGSQDWAVRHREMLFSLGKSLRGGFRV